MAEPKNSQGDTILSDPGTPEDDRAKQPTEASLKGDDKVAGTVVGDAEANDPPVRTNRPDVPIVQRLGVGAGDHIRPEPDADFDADGRFVGEVDAAKVDKKSDKK